MTISDVYDRLAQMARGEFGDVVLRTRRLYLPTGDPLKLRLDIVDQSALDVWRSTGGRYSYHWERRHIGAGDLFRYDNAPHKRWRHIASFPHHFHDGAEDVTVESHLSLDPEEALRQVLAFVRAKLMNETLPGHQSPD